MLIASAALFSCLIGGAKAGEEYERIITLKPRDATIYAWGKKGGRVYFALPDAIASLDAKGRLFRRAYPTRPPDLVGHFAFDGEDLIFVSRRDQRLKRLRADGSVLDLTARSEKLARGVGVWSGESGDLFAPIDSEHGFCTNECELEMLRFTKTGRSDGILKTYRYNLNPAGPRGAAVAKERIAKNKEMRKKLAEEDAAMKKVLPLVSAGKTSPEEVLAMAANEEQRDNWMRSLHNYGVSEAAAKKMVKVHELRPKGLDDGVVYWEKVLMSFSDEVSRRPCGEADGGEPITIAVNRGSHTYSLARLDRAMRPAKEALWGIAHDEHIAEVERFEREAMERALCDRTNGLTLLGWEHSGQMSLYRGKDPIFHDFVGMGENVYLLLGRGETIAVLQRGRDLEQGHILLLAKKGAAKEVPGDPLLTHRALAKAKDGDAILRKLDNMIDAGWWEDAQTAAEEALAQDWPAKIHDGIRSRVARARAAELVHLSEVSGELSEPKRDEAKQLAAEHPGSAIAQYAAALVLRASDSTGYLAHLERTAKALDVAKESWERYPRLFDLYQSRGDVEGMRRLAKSARDPLLEARILRAERRYDQALQIIAPLGEGSAEAVALRASLQLDAGKLNEAILSFTKALTMNKSPEVQHDLGIAYLRRGLSELAVESLLAATTADPKNARYISNLAAAYANLDKKEDALKHLFGALSQRPDDAVLRHQLERLSTAAKDAEQGGEVMVLPLGTSGADAQRVGLGDMVASMLITALSDAGGAIVERSRLEEILKEQKLQATAYFDPDTTVRLGKLAGAKKMIVGNVAEFSERLIIDLRVVDVATGRVISSKSADAKLEVESLRKALAQASKGLL